MFKPNLPSCCLSGLASGDRRWRRWRPRRPSRRTALLSAQEVCLSSTSPSQRSGLSLNLLIDESLRGGIGIGDGALEPQSADIKANTLHQPTQAADCLEMSRAAEPASGEPEPARQRALIMRPSPPPTSRPVHGGARGSPLICLQIVACSRSPPQAILPGCRTLSPRLASWAKASTL